MRPGEVDLKRLVPRTAKRAWTLRCPACGGRGVFARFAKLRETCPSCGHRFRREQGSQTGSMYLTAAVNQIFAALVILIVFTQTDWSLAVELAVSIPIVAVFCVAFLPFSQTVWAGVEYVTDCINAEPWIVSRDRSDPPRG